MALTKDEKTGLIIAGGVAAGALLLFLLTRQSELGVREVRIAKPNVTIINSYGLLGANQSDSTLLGTANMSSIIGASKYQGLDSFLVGTLTPGPLSNGISGFLIGIVRDKTISSFPLPNGIFSFLVPDASFPPNTELDSIVTQAVSNGSVATRHDTEKIPGLISLPPGDSLAFDLYLWRQGNGVSPADPGRWQLINGLATYTWHIFE